MAKYLFSDLSRSDYLKLHHLQKFHLLDQLVIKYLGWQGDYLRLAVQILYYTLENEDLSLLTIEKKGYLKNGRFFFLDDSLHQLRYAVSKLKKDRLKHRKRVQNRQNRKEGKKGVYVLLDKDTYDQFKQHLKQNKMTVSSFFDSAIKREIMSISQK